MKKGRKKYQNEKAIDASDRPCNNAMRAWDGLYYDHPLFKKVGYMVGGPRDDKWEQIGRSNKYRSDNFSYTITSKSIKARDKMDRRCRDEFMKEIEGALGKADDLFFDDVANILRSIRHTFYNGPTSLLITALALAHTYLSMGGQIPSRKEVVALARKRNPKMKGNESQISKAFAKLGIKFPRSVKAATKINSGVRVN